MTRTYIAKYKNILAFDGNEKAFLNVKHFLNISKTVKQNVCSSIGFFIKLLLIFVHKKWVKTSDFIKLIKCKVFSYIHGSYYNSVLSIKR